MIQMSSSIICNNHHVENRNENDHGIGIPRTHPFEEIENSLPHKLILGQWEKEEEILSRRIEQKDTRHMSIQNEIYQLLGLYFVLQGVVLSALFQALQQPNHNTCDSWWSPFSFSALCFLATLAALHHKFRVQLQIEEELLQEKEDCEILFNCIEKLRIEGALFDLQTKPTSSQDCTSTTPAKGLWCWSYWWGYRGIVTLVLWAFSVIILISCWFVLCSHLDSETGNKMCLKLRKSGSDVRITSMTASENGKGENKGWDKQTIIQNRTEDTIVLRDMHRYVWRQVRMELKPDESKKISVKAPSTFFRMGAILKVDERTEKDINVRIDTEQLVGWNKISICKDANGRYFIEKE